MDARSRFLLGVGVSLGAHVLAFVEMRHAKASVRPSPPPVVLEVDTAPAPPPTPPPAPEPEPEGAPAASPSRPSLAAPTPARAAPAAQAGRVLAAADDAPAVADFTIVEGAAASYVGGVTTRAGTSRTEGGAARAPTGTGAAGSAGTGAAGSAGADRSRRARPLGSDWDCSSMFPASASTDTATVTIVARVRPDGRPDAITIVADPGQGFGAAARACALRQRYEPAEDPSGTPILASTAPFRVRFTR